ncbi:hypothetical protein [Halorubellus salinus]|uniref:hypothetical protein n=1 Tax=Halorubellus salinus TaxID=755309 RepID=UPI001D08DB9B|nr:hypothetical protein [Halorubellus salinus]
MAGTYGVRNAAALLSLLPQAVSEAKTLYLSYSRRLIQLTERLFESRLPVSIERETSVGYSLRGSPDFARTVQEQARGTGRVVSREISFSIITPVTRLLAVFHRVLAVKLRLLAEDFELDDNRLERQFEYHGEVRHERLPSEVVGNAVAANIPSSDEIERMQASQFAAVRELVRLWLGFQQDKGIELDWQDRFDTAVKPVQRVYELWCLERIISILERSLGESEPKDSTRLPVPKRYDFPGDVTLFYDRSVRSIDGVSSSRHVGPDFRKPNAQVGKPDFLLAKDKRPVWVADAKFQTAESIDTSGLYRFLGYMIDFLAPGEGTAALLCAAGTPVRPQVSIEHRDTAVIATMSDVTAAEGRIEQSLQDTLDCV